MEPAAVTICREHSASHISQMITPSFKNHTCLKWARKIKNGKSAGNMCIAINEILNTFSAIKPAALPVGFYDPRAPGWLSERSS